MEKQKERIPLQNRMWAITPRKALVVGVVGVFTIGLLDMISGYELGFFVFYFISVALVAWRSGVAKGCLVAGVSAAIWYFVDYHTGKHYSHPFYSWWNAGIRLAAFLFVAYSIATIQRLLTAAHCEVAELRHFLRICAWCRKIATPEGQWVSMETFFETHTKSEITHGICPECAKSCVANLSRETEEECPPHIRKRR